MKIPAGGWHNILTDNHARERALTAERQRHLQTFQQSFDKFDTAKQNRVSRALLGGDGIVSRDDLQAVVEAGREKYSAEQIAAARYFLDNDAAFDSLEVAGDATPGRDGRVGEADVHVALLAAAREQERGSPFDEAAAQAAHDYAPVYYFHPEEKYLPADPNGFLSRADLKNHDGVTQDWDGRPESLRGLNGDYLLDFEQKSDGKDNRPGNTATAPVLYQAEEGPPPTITHWLFYNYNNKALDNLPDQNHEADWESVTVVFGNGLDREPTEVRYSAHGGGTSLPWSEAPKDENNHPIVNVALGSHAQSPYIGNQPAKAGVEDYFGVGGVRFDPTGQRADGTTHLQNIEDQSWWGTHVQWGQDGVFSFTSGVPAPRPPNADGEDGKGAVGATDHRAELSSVDRIVLDAPHDPAGAHEQYLLQRDALARFSAPADGLARTVVELWDRSGQLDQIAATPAGRELLRAAAQDLRNGTDHRG